MPESRLIVPFGNRPCNSLLRLSVAAPVVTAKGCKAAKVRPLVGATEDEWYRTARGAEGWATRAQVGRIRLQRV
jgi:hypothetical protein